MFHVKQKFYDVVILGGGHAGVEAAAAASKIGAKTALITFSRKDLGAMSCNPAMGGLGKGHLIREIDALGGIIGQASDISGIQFRMLNRTKGEAVQGPRAQIDRNKYKKAVSGLLKTLTIFEDEIEEIHLEKNIRKVRSVKLKELGNLNCQSLIVTTGTFLNGLIHCGQKSWSAGRLGAKATTKLAKFFLKEKFVIRRLKTGTPPRLLGSSINFKKCIEQKGDSQPVPFSFLTEELRLKQKACFITKTNETTHKIIRSNIYKSPMYNGKIKSKGPRYCPSIEDKVQRFKDRISHQIFLEPETEAGNIIYPNGISTALPSNVQKKFLRSINGLEEVQILKDGYAIEYDTIDSKELKNTYETKKIEGLYLAGQINGSTGYEEAAGQGLLAGINAANKVLGKKSFVLGRSDAYLGVLTSDLMKGGLVEPYRMFTSRAEYRLTLRADNADYRLTDKAINLGLACKDRSKKWIKRKKALETGTKLLRQNYATPHKIKAKGLDINQDGKKRSAYEVLGYNNSNWQLITSIWPQLKKLNISEKEKDQIRITAFYEKYVERQMGEIEELKKEAGLKFKSNFNVKDCAGLSNEVKEILLKNSPKTLGEASLLPGMTPSAASLLLKHTKK